MVAFCPRQPAPRPRRRPVRALAVVFLVEAWLARSPLTSDPAFAEVVIGGRDDLDVDLDQPRRTIQGGYDVCWLVGFQAMEELLPGLTTGLVAKGVVPPQGL